VPLSLTIITARCDHQLGSQTARMVRDRSVRNERQALAAADVDHDQDTHAAAVNDLLG
jgi:hypothetical protein